MDENALLNYHTNLGNCCLLGEEIKNDNNTVFLRVGSILETAVFYERFTLVKS